MTSLANILPLRTSGSPFIQAIGISGSSTEPDPSSTPNAAVGATPSLSPDAEVGSTPSRSPAAPEFGGAEEGGVKGETGEGGDRVTISPEARALGERAPAGQETNVAAEIIGTEEALKTDDATKGEEAAEPDEAAGKQGEEDSNELDESEQDLVRRLEARDREVRAHEQAHITAAGGLAKGSAKFEYQRGPDEKQYAVGGHVDINVSPVPNDPEATIARADRVKRAALAPAEPSGKDRQVAARANKMKLDAQKELTEQRQTAIEEEATGKAGDSVETSPASAGEGQATKKNGQEKALPPGNAATYNILGRNNTGSIPSIGLSVTA